VVLRLNIQWVTAVGLAHFGGVVGNGLKNKRDVCPSALVDCRSLLVPVFVNIEIGLGIGKEASSSTLMSIVAESQ
jgi:hypothetical protein